MIEVWQIVYCLAVGAAVGWLLRILYEEVRLG